MKTLRERLEWYDLGQKIFPWALIVMAATAITLLYYMPSILFGESTSLSADNCSFEMTDDHTVVLKSLSGEVIETYEHSTEPLGGNELFSPEYSGRAPMATNGYDYKQKYDTYRNLMCSVLRQLGQEDKINDKLDECALLTITHPNGVITWVGKDGAIASATITSTGRVMVAFYCELDSPLIAQQ